MQVTPQSQGIQQRAFGVSGTWHLLGISLLQVGHPKRLRMLIITGNLGVFNSEFD